MLSVITVNYNNKEGLERTIKSVCSQSYRKFEYIIIDGGSNDGSLDVINNFKNDIDYFESKKDNGIYHAMNKGIKVAKGDYLLFLNSGDHFYSNKSLSFFKPYLLKQDKIDILYGNIMVKSQKEFIKTYPEALTFSYFVKDTLPHPGSLINKKCFNHFLYDEDLKITSDWKFFMLGLCKKKYTYMYINQVISTFYLDGISSTNIDLVKRERHQVLTKEFFWQLYFNNLLEKVKRHNPF
ncbi:glycosyltransferase family 2 protein [uncultured Algibacter sp.]|uniref:glycosyltransferase family 2 protein n=1 Tax=uncultured Algibacter sp. TaxID=298659 RepID=UPI00262A39FE|nr:glycosyltransferase family 2 protein [uncultured Algibacter sp.]